MEIKEADHILKQGKSVLYNGHEYKVKELVIWYDIQNRRKCSLILLDDKKNIYRVSIEQCEIKEE